MQFPDVIFWLIFGSMIVYFVYNVFRRGGFKAAFFNAAITGSIGEVELTGPKLMSQRIKVHTLDRDGEALVGIEIVSKSIGSYEMLPLVLSSAQARQLLSLLQQAAKRP